MNNVWIVRVQICRWLTVALFFSVLAHASELPDLVLPAGVGVNIHFIRGQERDLDLIAAAGFKFTRMDFFWSETEKEPGSYDWSAYDELTGNLDRHGLRAYYILDYSNPLYETNGLPPQHPESVAAFARWAAAAARHFHGRHVIWEIWNEPNGQFWKPKANGEQYATLALATAKAVRAAEPKATIVGPAAESFPWAFLETFFKSGVLEYLDAVSVHPYRGPRSAPETAAGNFQKLRQLIEQYAPANKRKMPILSGEWGYSTFVKGTTPEVQAAFAARQQLSNLLNEVPVSIWYDWKNDGGDPRENEDNFGTVSQDLQPKPAYTAIKTLTSELAGFRIASRYATANTNDYVLVLKNHGKTKLAAWTRSKPHMIELSLGAAREKAIPLVDSEGQAGRAEITTNGFMLPLSSAPRYVTLGWSRLNVQK